eukprot:1997513-Pyramimonas_sp.AAC.1
MSAHSSHAPRPHKAPSPRPACLLQTFSAHPLHASWPQRGLHRRLQCQGPHGLVLTIPAHPFYVS